MISQTQIEQMQDELSLKEFMLKTSLASKASDKSTALYVAPPQRKPLTDEEIERIYTQETGSFIDDSPWPLIDFVRAIEAAHGIKE